MSCEATAATWDAASSAVGQIVTEGPLVGLDLPILGYPAEDFERDDRDVREQYARMPGMRFRGARAQSMRSVLAQPRPHPGHAAAALPEPKARINPASALLPLTQ